MKKLTIFLAALCLCAFTNKATAQFSGGDGSENNPYIITTAAQLAELATYVNNGNESYDAKFYKLGNDIDLSAYQSGTGWTPIGNDNNGFHGYFNGNGKKITGLYINNPSLDYAGLFGYFRSVAVEMSAPALENIAVENVNIRGRDYVGGVAGDVCGTIFKNCYATGEVSGNDYVGGLVGEIYATMFSDNIGYLKNCCFTGNVSGNDRVGGLAGKIQQYSLAGSCYTTGKVSGHDYVGGLIGSLYNGSTVSCYSTSEVSGNDEVGGVVGTFSRDWSYICSISHSVALNPSVKASSEYVGRILGYYGGTIYENAAWDGILNNNGNTIWNNKGDDEKDGEDMSLQTIKSDGTLGGRFSTADGWTIQNGKLPGLFGKPVDMPAHLGGVGIDDELTIENGELTIYPNPTDGQLQITNYELRIENIEIFDVMGRKVQSFEFKVQSSEFLNFKPETLNISNLPTGIYFLRIQTENGKITTQKIIKR
jgi:hypothetical protein